MLFSCKLVQLLRKYSRTVNTNTPNWPQIQHLTNIEDYSDTKETSPHQQMANWKEQSLFSIFKHDQSL